MGGAWVEFLSVCQSATGLCHKIWNAQGSGGGRGAVQLEVHESSLKLRVSEELLLNPGISFDAFVDVVKKGKAAESSLAGSVNVGT